MKPILLHIGAIGLALAALSTAAQNKPATGPQTEKRFPPLQVPAGFKATLFACDPLIEYPSAITAGPRPNSLFVAVDYMTGLGTEIVRRDEVRLAEDTDGDGYADKAPVYADGFNSIMGLAYHDGTLFVMHAPFLTAIKKTPDGKVIRQDLLSGLGLTPEKNPVRLHCANGVTVGHDGWLYLAMGDNGVNVPRPEGDRLILNGGGILRCRPDGRDLHVFARGLRNIYDVALDEDLNVFVRDNENDGGEYKIRVCHSFFGADHGYPYHYYERPDEALPPLADLGLGSSAGVVVYLERCFPAAFRGTLFCCEWGRSVVHYAPQRSGSGFGPVKEQEFAAGAANDPYGFKPTDLAVGRDGALYVSDWADGQRPKRGRGRIYRVTANDSDAPPRATPTALPELIQRLDSESLYERTDAQDALQTKGAEGLRAVRAALPKLGVRGRLHAIWLFASQGNAAIAELLALAENDADARVQAQAIRAVADLSDPVLIRHRLDAGAGDAEPAKLLAKLAKGRDPQVVREIIVALGRLGWPETPAWLPTVLDRPDPALLHAAMQALRGSRNWPGVLKLLDQSDEAIRLLALRALADRYEAAVVDGLIERAKKDPDPLWRQRYGDALTRVHRQPAPWIYWGYRPAPRPANSAKWERTEAIEAELDRLLGDKEVGVRLAVLQRVRREQVPTRIETLAGWLRQERDAGRVAVILDALAQHPPGATRATLVEVVRARDQSEANRLAALAPFVAGLDVSSENQLADLVAALDDGPVLAEALRQTGKRPRLTINPVLVTKMQSAQPVVRAAAIDALAERQATDARDAVSKLLDDPEPLVRRSAAAAAGKLSIPGTADRLLTLAKDADPMVRRASLDSLRLLKDRRAVPLAVTALTDHQTELTALLCLGELAGAEQAKPVIELARRHPSVEILATTVRVLTDWNRSDLPTDQRRELDRAVAQLQGTSGTLIRWQLVGPIATAAAQRSLDRFAAGQPPLEESARRAAFATGTESRLSLGKAADANTASWLLYTELEMPQETAVEFLGSGSGELQVFLNGRSIHRRDPPRGFQVDSDRFAATLTPGSNRLLVRVATTQGNAEFQLRFRRKSSAVEHEKLTQAALTRKGDVERGRKLFLDAEKSQCLKCHRLQDQGEKIGPELTGVGSRFSPIHIVESILEPSRTIAPSFESYSVIMKDGKILTGVRVEETAATLTLADNQGQKHVLQKANIDERQPNPTSIMPEGLEKRLTLDEFVDLIAFLVSQKQQRER